MSTKNLLGSLRTIAFTALLACGFASVANAAVLVEYDFTGGTQNPTSEEANISGGTFTGANGLIDISYDTPGATARGWNPGNSFSEALSHSNFWQFAITADPGYVFNLESITLSQVADGSGPGTFGIGLSFDGNSWEFISAATSTTDTLTELTVSLTGSNLTNLTSAIIGIFGWDADNNGGNSYWTVDDIQVNGEVVAATSVVPEPASFALLSIGTLGLAGVAARRRAREAKAGK